MTNPMTIPQAAVDAAAEGIYERAFRQELPEAPIDLARAALEAAMPEIRKQIIEELTDFSDTSYNYHPSFTEATFRAIRIVKGADK